MARTSQSEAVIIKGVRGGLLILLEDKEAWPDLLRELEERIRANESFFRGASATVNLAARLLTAEELTELRELLARYEVGLGNLVSGAEETRAAASSLALEARAPSFTGSKRGSKVAATEPEPPPSRSIVEASEAERNALFIQHTIRSGQRLQHDGDICIVGDVNAGAEVVAGGNVLVWGSLRGLVHAGANGNDKATICALQLEATQLRIGEVVGRGPGREQAKGGNLFGRLRGKNGQATLPECAQVADGQIVVESWRGRTRK